ncbi:RidA family protein [Pseudenhygromyxa sp. WMMC2535]|uniref:Rid family detoxifying hydrolase n=1 Tax=Pseudenhygromyxa sp. WMMC2535 TaxID=2712867 RepID=UPI001553E85D|nr:Rid family detoxifying hydrolase [Pseudenhygromyxa sp. WMMC2535]NVB41192.1 RidA family protein [Pseudenhygromyxa sp. WMMC2535]
MSEFQREVISAQDAPAAIGNYNQAVVVSGERTLFASGQIGLIPGKPELGITGDVAQQTEQVMNNLAAVLAAADMNFANVARATIYLASMADFAVVDEIYGRHFEAGKQPARVTIQAAGLPKGALVEIDVIAVG